MKLFREVKNRKADYCAWPINEDLIHEDHVPIEPIDITEEALAQFMINWGITFAPDECVDDDLEWKEYAMALSFAKDILSEFIG